MCRITIAVRNRVCRNPIRGEPFFEACADAPKEAVVNGSHAATGCGIVEGTWAEPVMVSVDKRCSRADCTYCNKGGRWKCCGGSANRELECRNLNEGTKVCFICRHEVCDLCQPADENRAERSWEA